MLAFMEIATFLQLLDYGITIVMLVVFMRMYKGKDKAHEDLHAQSTERLTELLVETTKALQDKNHTDDSMAKALDELVDVIRPLGIKENRNEETS